MDFDLELYRKDVLVPDRLPVRLSVIDIAPDYPQKTFVFIHGFGGRATQWEYQLRHFGFKNRVIAPDLRGHGRSESPHSAYSMSRLVEDLQAILETLGVAGDFILGGHSFGGAIACEYAKAHPERVARLVLVACAGEYRLNPFYRLALNLPLPLLRLIVPFTRGRLGASTHALKDMYIHSLSRWNGWSLFQSLTVPTLVIRGHLDLVLEKPMFAEVARAIPGSEEVDVGSSGHMVMLERRQAVNRSIERFVEETRSTWRESYLTPETTSRAELVRSRPWLAHYDDNVPYTVAVPRLPLFQLLTSAVRRFPMHPAIFFEGARITFLRLSQESNQFARALSALGVKKGDRVMLLLPNLPQMVIAFFGVLKAGAVAVFSLPNLERQELVRQVLDSEARVIVTLTAFHELVSAVLSEVRQAIPSQDFSTEAGIARPFQVIFTSISDYLPPWKRWLLAAKMRASSPEAKQRIPIAEQYDFRKLLKAHSRQNFETSVAATDLAVIQYTGGTTANPKGVMLSHYNLLANAIQTRSWMQNAQEGHERVLAVVPFSHSYGLSTALNVAVSMGAALILKPRFEVADILKTIRRYKPTIFPGVPAMYVAINDYPGVRRYGVNSIKACISGSAPLPVEVQEAFEKLTRGRLVEGYGLTEASPVTHANPLLGRRKIGSIGAPLPSTEARLVDLSHSDEEAPLGQIGELAVRGPQVMMGYWENPEATRKAITPDGWLLTGDVAQMDEEGYFRIIARKADMWYPDKPETPAFPRDIEEVLFEIPQVKEAAVVAIAGQPVAFIIAKKERPSLEAIQAYCRRRLPPELVPRLVVFLEDFPRSFIGKVLRRELAKRFEESRQAQAERQEPI